MPQLLLLFLTLMASFVAHANPLQDDLLEPEKAFQSTLRAIDGETVEADFKIADGYYLYRDKFKFEALDPGVMVKEAKIPAGVKKHDEYFGDVETYRKAVKIILKLGRNNPAAQPLKLKVTAQGCADVGVCYPPQVKTFDLKLAALQTPPSDPKAQSLSGLSNLLEPHSDEFLDPDQAFRLSVIPAGKDALLARIDIAPGYYLYRDKIRFQANGLGTYQLPRGQVKVDEFFGKTEIYHDRVETQLPLVTAGSRVELTANYQGCAEKGICYPPVTKKVSVDLDGASAAVAANNGSQKPSNAPPPRSFAAFAAAVLTAFGIGLALTFTPCVLPMIPILSSIIVGQGGQNISKARGGFLSLAYVLGTAATYTVAGVLAGASGDQLQAYFQNIWAIGGLSLIFVALALSMFGFYELQMPSFIQSRLQERTQTLKSGSYIGVFAMGALSALIVGACVSPLLISALSVAISSKDPVLGGAIMFAMAMGMGVVLIAIGIGAGSILPKAGPWMDKVKYVFGVLLLAVAIYLLGVLPQVPVLYFWAALLIVTGVYLNATQPLAPGASGWAYLAKGIGTVLLVWGSLALIGAFYGQRDILKPLPSQWTAGGTATATTAAREPGGFAELGFKRVSTVADYQRAFAAAQAQHKPILVDFYASWCTDCLRMEKITLADPRVRAALRSFALIQADVTENNDDTRKLKQALNVLGPPATLLFTVSGNEQRDLRFYGFKSSDEFLAVLSKLQ